MNKLWGGGEKRIGGSVCFRSSLIAFIGLCLRHWKRKRSRNSGGREETCGVLIRTVTVNKSRVGGE